MPNFDRTGPQGQGTMTGRRRGQCQNTQIAQSEKSENESSSNDNIVYGLGRGGRPRGGGGFWKQLNTSNEKGITNNRRCQNRNGRKQGAEL